MVTHCDLPLVYISCRARLWIAIFLLLVKLGENYGVIHGHITSSRPAITEVGFAGLKDLVAQMVHLL